MIQNLTGGFDTAWESFAINSEFMAGRSIAFDPRGDHVGFFGRTGKGRSFFLVSVLDGKIQKKVPIAARRGAGAVPPRRRPDASSSPRSRRASPTSGSSTSRPARSRTSPRTSTRTTTRRSRPDGKLVVYERRISGHAKIYAFPLARPRRARRSSPSAPSTTRRPSSRPTARRSTTPRTRTTTSPTCAASTCRRASIAAVHRRLRRHDGAGAAQDAARRPARLHHLLQGRVPLHTKDTAEPVKEVEQEVQLGRRGPRRLPARRDPRGRAREQAAQEALRGALPRGPAADQRGRHLERRLLRRHRGRPHRRARRPDCSPSTVLSVASYRIYDGQLHEPRAPPALRGQRLRPDLLLLPVLRAVRPVLRLRHARPRDRDPALHRRAGLRASTRSTRSAGSRSGPGIVKVDGAVRGPGASSSWSASRARRRACPASSTTAGRLPVSAAHRPGDDPLRRVRPALRQHLQPWA